MKVECLKISNQRQCFYIKFEGITQCELFRLWISLSEKGYYKIDKHIFYIDPFDSNISYFSDLHSFKDNRGLL